MKASSARPDAGGQHPPPPGPRLVGGDSQLAVGYGQELHDWAATLQLRT